MDKSWIYNKNKLSQKYIHGLRNFISLSRNHLNNENKIRCPCVVCLNLYFHDLETIEHHLRVKGFSTHYIDWVFHGEDTMNENNNLESNIGEDNETYDEDDDNDDNEDNKGDMIPTIEDLAREDPKESNFENTNDSNDHYNNRSNRFAEAEQ